MKSTTTEEKKHKMHVGDKGTIYEHLYLSSVTPKQHSVFKGVKN